jgi:hypothetical protein
MAMAPVKSEHASLLDVTNREDSPGGFVLSMTIEVREEPMTITPEYARVPMIFTVDRVLENRIAPRGSPDELAISLSALRAGARLL